MFGTPLYVNEKCLIFSAFVLAVYYLPHPKHLTHRILAGFILACLAYVVMAWYDYIYDCNDRLRPTILGWMWGWAKPAEYRKEFDALPVKYKKIVRWVDIAVLAVVVLAIVYPYLHK